MRLQCKVKNKKISLKSVENIQQSIVASRVMRTIFYLYFSFLFIVALQHLAAQIPAQPQAMLLTLVHRTAHLHVTINRQLLLLLLPPSDPLPLSDKMPILLKLALLLQMKK